MRNLPQKIITFFQHIPCDLEITGFVLIKIKFRHKNVLSLSYGVRVFKLSDRTKLESLPHKTFLFCVVIFLIILR